LRLRRHGGERQSAAHEERKPVESETLAGGRVHIHVYPKKVHKKRSAVGKAMNQNANDNDSH
jgi:hypothetical protein